MEKMIWNFPREIGSLEAEVGVAAAETFDSQWVVWPTAIASRQWVQDDTLLKRRSNLSKVSHCPRV